MRLTHMCLSLKYHPAKLHMNLNMYQNHEFLAHQTIQNICLSTNFHSAKNFIVIFTL